MNSVTFLRVSAIALALWTLMFTSLAGQVAVEVEAGPFVGGTVFLNAPNQQVSIARQGAAPLLVEGGQFRNAVTVGVHAGIRVGQRLGLEGSYAWIPTRLAAGRGLEAQGGAVDVNAIRYGVMTTYHFRPHAGLQPFAGVGLSGETLSYGPHAGWERRSSLAGTVELGGNLWLSDDVFLRLGAGRDVLTRGERGSANKLMMTAGVSARQRIR
jgi:outer membrane protein W